MEHKGQGLGPAPVPDRPGGGGRVMDYHLGHDLIKRGHRVASIQVGRHGCFIWGGSWGAGAFEELDRCGWEVSDEGVDTLKKEGALGATQVR
jgi:hypothetical protein